MPVAALRETGLGPGLIPAGLLLSSEAGWNQIDADWRFMLASGSSFGFADPTGRLVASGLTVDFERYAWISMILVTADWRRQGLATRLMESCVGALKARGLVPALDASPDGREVYRRLGFRDDGTLTRLVGDLTTVQDRGVTNGIMSATAGDLAAITAYDRRSSGTDRSALLGHLLERFPGAAFVARQGTTVTGFVMARRGRMLSQIGPLVADHAELAEALLVRAGRAVGGPICLDLFDQRAGLRAFLDGRGFKPVTRFIRMVLGEAEIFPAGHRTYIIAGPELS